YIIVFFFQAEDGIRDRNVTGVQTCALPISTKDATAKAETTKAEFRRNIIIIAAISGVLVVALSILLILFAYHEGFSSANDSMARSEERRVGKECSFLLFYVYRLK